MCLQPRQTAGRQGRVQEDDHSNAGILREYPFEKLKDVPELLGTWFFEIKPTYWIGVENSDIKIIRSLVNSWCRFNVKKNGKSLVDFAREKKFKGAYSLFKSLESQMVGGNRAWKSSRNHLSQNLDDLKELCSAVFALNVPKIEAILGNSDLNLKMNFKNMVSLISQSPMLKYCVNVEILERKWRHHHVLCNQGERLRHAQSAAQVPAKHLERIHDRRPRRMLLLGDICLP